MNSKITTVEDLNTFIPIFYEAVNGGFNDYFHTLGNSTVKYRPTTRANVIYDNIIGRLKKSIVGHPKVSFLNRKGLLAVLINDKYLVRFKKLNEN